MSLFPRTGLMSSFPDMNRAFDQTLLGLATIVNVTQSSKTERPLHQLHQILIIARLHAISRPTALSYLVQNGACGRSRRTCTCALVIVKVVTSTVGVARFTCLSLCVRISGLWCGPSWWSALSMQPQCTFTVAVRQDTWSSCAQNTLKTTHTCSMASFLHPYAFQCNKKRHTVLV